MKCMLIVTSGKERSQRSCEMPTRPSTRDELVAFLKAQDLRLEAGGFDFTVSLDGVESGSTLRTDADVRLFLAQAKQMGDRATFHIRLRRDPAAPPDMESFLSAEYAVDLDLVTLHIYPHTTSPSFTPQQAFQEKMFVVPSRYVLDGLQRAVRDVVADGTGKKHTRLTLLALSSAEDRTGTALADDAAALSFLRAQAKLREPARLTYAVEAARTPTARTPTARTPTAQSPTAQSVGELKHQSEMPHTPAAPGRASPTKAAAAAPAVAAPRVDSPPPVDEDAKPVPQPPATLPPPPAVRSPLAAAPLAATPPDQPIPPSSSDTPYQAFLRDPPTPAMTASALVEVRTAESVAAQSFTFTYMKREVQLHRRFTTECAARFTLGGAPALTLSSDPSVVIDSDGVLRELLALAREAQQPLRVRLHALSPPKSRRASREGEAVAAQPPAELPPPPRPAAAQLDVAALKTQTSPKSNVAVLTALAESTEKKEKEKKSNGVPKANGSSSAHPQHPPGPQAPLRRLSGSARTPLHSPNAHLQTADTKSAEKGASAASPVAPPAPPTPVTAAAAGAPPVTTTAAAAAEAEVKRDPSIEARRTPPQPAPLHSCFSAVERDGDGESVECRVQVVARWGLQQRVLLCRVRRDHMYEDFCTHILTCFGVVQEENNDSSGTSTADMAMEFVYMDGSEVRTVALTAETTLEALPACLFVETTELRVTTPTAALMAPPAVAADEAQDGALRHFVASASLRQLEQVSLPFTAAEVHTLMTGLLGAQATVEPHSVFLAALRASCQADPPQPPGAAPGVSIDAAEAQLRERLLRVVGESQLSPAQLRAVLQDAASSLLCADMRDEEGVLSCFVDRVSRVMKSAADTDSVTAAALQTLWQEARKAPPIREGSETTAPSARAECAEALPVTSQQWRTAYAKAPPAVLNTLAAAAMDGLLPPLSEPANVLDGAAVVWRDAFHKAQLQFCEMVTPSELEEYFKGDAAAQSSGEEGLLCRSVLMSCMGALLAPAALTEDYRDWLIGHFRGRVGAVLYAKMGSFDGRTALSQPGLISLTWTLLHPAVPSLVRASAQPELVERLMGWARVAAAHACHVRHCAFPPCPLLHVHGAVPLPLPRCTMPPAPPAEDSVVSALSMQPAAPSPPPEAPPPVDRRTPRKRVHYVYKYNLNALNRPRSSAT